MITGIIVSMRPKQWTKNLFVFAGLVFSRNITNPLLTLRSAAAFLVFCFVSGAVYLVNDVFDRGKDSNHPEKAFRPVASGRLSVRAALFAAVVITAGALSASLLLGTGFFITVLLYFSLQAAYSVALKNIAILDVFVIAVGFVLRVIAGSLVIDVRISSWLLLCTILLALFLALSKRRHELVMLEEAANSHRRVLDHYSPYLLDQMIAVVTASTVMAYALYTMADETIQKFQTDKLIYTLPFVIYGIFRYLYLVHQKGEGGNPENILIRDIPLILDIIVWIITVFVILYL